MAEEPIVVSKEGSESEQGTPPVESEEVKELLAQKVKLEEEIKGFEGTKQSLIDDIVRKRQERKATLPDPEPLDEEALWDRFSPRIEEKLQSTVKPLNDENTLLRQQLALQQEEAIKAKKAHVESINARIASATAARPSASQPDHTEPNVELSAGEAKIAKELGLKNLRYMKETEVL